MDAANIPAKLEVRSFTRCWDNRGYSKTLESPWIRPRFRFSQIFKGLLLGWTLWIYLPHLKFVALRVPEIIGGTRKKLESLWISPRSLFSQIFKGLLLGWTLRIYLPNLKSLALAVPEIIAIAVLGCSCEPQSRGRGSRRGSWMVPFERAFVTSYRPSIVTFPLSLRVLEILPLLCSSTPLFPTPPLVSSKFPHVPLGVGGLALGYEERRCWAKCPCN